MTVRIVLACPHCGHTGFAYAAAEFECLECGETVFPEEMSHKVLEVHELSQVGLQELNT